MTCHVSECCWQYKKFWIWKE